MSTSKEQVIKLGKFEDQILELIDAPPDMPRGDLQGVVMGIVLNAFIFGKECARKVDHNSIQGNIDQLEGIAQNLCALLNDGVVIDEKEKNTIADIVHRINGMKAAFPVQLYDCEIKYTDKKTGLNGGGAVTYEAVAMLWKDGWTIEKVKDYNGKLDYLLQNLKERDEVKQNIKDTDQPAYVKDLEEGLSIIEDEIEKIIKVKGGDNRQG
jgi:hypothetical protein